MDKPANKSDGLKVPSLVFLILDILGCIFLGGILPFFHYKFVNTVNETGAAGTQAGSIVTNIHPLMLAIFFIVIIAVLIFKENAIKNKIITLIINILVGLGLLVIIPLYVWAVFIPLFQEIDKLAK